MKCEDTADAICKILESLAEENTRINHRFEYFRVYNAAENLIIAWRMGWDIEASLQRLESLLPTLENRPQKS